jgi:hypothetical protein
LFALFDVWLDEESRDWNPAPVSPIVGMRFVISDWPSNPVGVATLHDLLFERTVFATLRSGMIKDIPRSGIAVHHSLVGKAEVGLSQEYAFRPFLRDKTTGFSLFFARQLVSLPRIALGQWIRALRRL